MPWPQFAVISLGAGVGAVLRWLTGLWLNERWHGFPLGTLFVNCVGGLLVGVALA
jgi:CrcB protein